MVNVKMRVVSVSDQRSAHRLMNLVLRSLSDAKVELTEDERHRLMVALIEQHEAEGLTLTWQTR